MIINPCPLHDDGILVLRFRIRVTYGRGIFPAFARRGGCAVKKYSPSVEKAQTGRLSRNRSASRKSTGSATRTFIYQPPRLRPLRSLRGIFLRAQPTRLAKAGSRT